MMFAILIIVAIALFILFLTLVLDAIDTDYGPSDMLLLLFTAGLILSSFFLEFTVRAFLAQYFPSLLD